MDHGSQVAVGRRDDADIDLDRFLSTHTLDLMLLQYPQQTNLSGQRQLTDFIQEQRTPIGTLKPTLTLV